MTINDTIYIPISDSEIELVHWLLTKTDNEEIKLQVEKELKKGKETHLISEVQIKQFFQKIVDDYKVNYNFNLPNPFESIAKFSIKTSKPYYELLKQTLEQFNYNEETLKKIDNLSNSYSSKFERIQGRRSRRTSETTDNSTQLQEQIKQYFKYAIELAQIDKLADDVREYDSMQTIANDIVSEIEKYNLPLNDIKETCTSFNNNFSTDFETIREQIDKYNDYMQNYYQEHINNVIDFKNGQNFNFIVHRVTSGFPDTLDFKTNYVSASLITDKTMGLYGGFIEQGLLVDRKGFILKPENIISAQHKDTMTGNRENEVNELFYRQGFAILTPQTIEQRCLDIAKENSSDQLSEKAQIYSEIVIDGFQPSAIFCITNGEGTLNQDYIIAQRQAEKYGLPLIDINQREYRIKAGLSPLTDIGEINLTREVIKKIMPNFLKNINDFDILKDELMTDYVCKNIAEIFNKMSDEQSYNEEDFVKLASEVITKEIKNGNKISSDRQNAMLQTIDSYFEKIKETQAFSPETQKLLDEADSVLGSNQPDTVIEYEEVKQNTNDTQILNEFSLEQLEELSKTGKMQTQTGQNKSR